MRTSLFALAAVAAFVTIALPREGNAQGRRPTPTPTATPSSPWIDVPEGGHTATAAPAHSSTAASAAAAPRGEDVTYRPVEKSVAIGAGYAFGGTGGTGELLWNPNTVSARFRLPSGLALEPIAGIVLVNDNSKVASAKTTSTQTEIFAGANVRKPLWSRAQADMVVIGGANVEIGSASSKVGSAKTTSSSTGFGASYGLGVEFWPRSHWSVSFDATTQLLGFTATNSKDAAGVKTTATQMIISPAFDPSIRLMAHLYY